MTEIQWTDAERGTAAGALRKSRLTWGTHSDRWGDTPWQRDFWGEAADTVLDALAPFVAAREAQAAAKAEERVKQAIRECHDDPAKAVFDADRLAGEAILRAHAAEAALAEIAATGCCACHGPAAAERDRWKRAWQDCERAWAQDRETLRLRSDALDRVRREVEKCRRLVADGLLTEAEAFHVIGNVVLRGDSCGHPNHGSADHDCAPSQPTP